MAPSIDATFALVPIAPFLAAFLAPFIHRFAGGAAGWVLAIVPASIFVYLLSFVGPVADGQIFNFQLNWLDGAVWQLESGNVSFPPVPLSFMLDGLSLTFGLLISGIGTVIVVYSGAYLDGHKHQGRFFAFILMFMGSMMGLVMSDNMLVLFVFWELTAITSFLLIGFDHTREAARRAAIQALVVTGGGGLALLAGVILLQQMMGTWELSYIFPYGTAIVEEPGYLVIMILFCVAAFTKSAQFPFHFWLPNAMEAPTPVSAYLHSATMVKAGVYLLARMNPILGSSTVWTITLVTFGGVTLLYGATLALRQTDMKQMLAQTTLASLGLLVLLIGVGTEAAISAAVIYLIAHALYKAALFLIAGMIDHETGTREITALGGLWRVMPVTFLAAVLAAASMAGLPPALGFFAKEEMYLGLTAMNPESMIVLVVLILGNAMMLVVGAAIAIKPFLGSLKSTPLKPHEAPLSMWAGPMIFGVLAMVAGLMPYDFGKIFMAPAASAIFNFEIESHLKSVLEVVQNPLVAVSVATWLLGALIYWHLTGIRRGLKRIEAFIGWNFDKGFDALMFGLIRIADAITRFWHHGRLELYLVVVFVVLAAALYVPMALLGGVPGTFEMPQLSFYEWGIVLMAVLGLIGVVLAPTRLVAIVSLGIQGFAVALIFMLFGAPDLAFTQFMVEILSVVILALVMTRLRLEQRDSRVLEDVIRDGSLAIACGVGLSVLLVSILRVPFDTRLSDFFAETSVAIANGYNVVNVILVDYRGLDTLGEIAVVMTAGIAILALIRLRAGGPRRATSQRAATTASRKPATQRKPTKLAGAKS